MGIVDYQAKLAEAIALIEASDFGGADLKLMSAQAMLAGIPDSEIGGDTFAFRNDLESLIKTNNRRRGSAAGIQTAKLVTVSEVSDV